MSNAHKQKSVFCWFSESFKKNTICEGYCPKNRGKTNQPQEKNEKTKSNQGNLWRKTLGFSPQLWFFDFLKVFLVAWVFPQFCLVFDNIPHKHIATRGFVGLWKPGLLG